MQQNLHALKYFVSSDMTWYQSSGPVVPQNVCLQYGVDSSLHQWHQNKFLLVCCSWQIRWLCYHTAGLPVLPLAFARASVLSRPQDQDLAGPRYRRQAVCFSRPEPLWGIHVGDRTGSTFLCCSAKRAAVSVSVCFQCFNVREHRQKLSARTL